MLSSRFSLKRTGYIVHFLYYLLPLAYSTHVQFGIQLSEDVVQSYSAIQILRS